MAAPGAVPAAQLQLWECKCIGLLSNERAGPFIQLLRGMCYKYFQFSDQHEILLQAPLLSGTSSASIRLVRAPEDRPATNQPAVGGGATAAEAPCRWVLVHEGQLLKGAAYSELPASVREVCEVRCCGSGGGSGLDAWQALGCKVEAELVRKGQEYRCMHQGYDIKVQVVQLEQLPSPGGLASPRSLTGPHHFVVEASCLVGKEKQTEGALALGAFAQQLLPLVQMRKAEVQWQ